jgi:deoxyribodipyrimidine photo-lyase
MVKNERILPVNKFEYKKGKVLYIMNRDMRVSDNWALIFAYEQAKKHNTELVILYTLVPSFLGGIQRQLEFKVESILDIQESLLSLNIPFNVVCDDTGKEINEKVLKFIEDNNIGLLVTDFSPLKIQKFWVNDLNKKVDVPFYIVDAHNIIPAWYLSNKQEFAAYTIRPKVFNKIEYFLDEFPKIKKFSKSVKRQNLDFVKRFYFKEEDVFYSKKFLGGEKNALKTLNLFLKSKIDQYSIKRNDPTLNFQSDLSPYIHYGNISSQRIVLSLLKFKGKKIKDFLKEKSNGSGNDRDSISSFLEEIIVRKELSDNFCFYNTNYDSILGLPSWGIKTLNRHEKDQRDFLYTKKQFEFAKTHDLLWNAAQKELLKTGKMHGYMRMYWAKKILEWSTTPKGAIKIAIYLNDKYSLDGRDPNGYVGILWSIGGLHDRAWFERSVFGLVRYMNESGCKKKFSTLSYIKKFS